MLIDTHAHLTDEEFDPKVVLKQCEAEGVHRVISVGFDLPSSQDCVRLANAFDGVYAAVGVHPEHAATWNPSVCEELMRLAKEEKTVAIGEIGLDYHWEPFDKAVQARCFAEQIDLAFSCKLPFAVHMRDATEDTLRILKDNRNKLAYGGVMHCFSGSAETVKEVLNLGMYVSFSGSVTFKNARGLLDAAKAVPLDRILTETDSPYLTPHPYRGKRNAPFYVRLVAEKLAELHDVSLEELCTNVQQNAQTLFAKLR